MMFSIIISASTLGFAFLLFAKGKNKGNIALGLVLLIAGLSSWIAFGALFGEPFESLFKGGLVFGDISIRIDSLSGWFILVMNFTMVTGILYGVHYMKPYNNQSTNITIHYASYIVNQLAMIGIYSLQNSLAFLCAWEFMAISAFLLIIFDHGKIEILKAGLNYLVQSHICMVFLTIGFLWVSSNTGSFDFNAISNYSALISPELSFVLFSCFFIAFAIKAGFVPFHTWLPYAHPAAPAHVSGVMSGVIIKLGIYGIFRMILLINENHLQIGYAILIISMITGVYGVMLAIIQHNLKKLLAYHSIENIGIIGIGIGLGAIGLGLDKPHLVFMGFTGALLHTFNHSLFKSLLFYAAGTVYQATHTMNIEKLGGLIKRMPQTTTLFLLAALAISGLPPFNGFISEFLIYSGLFSGIQSHQWAHSVMIVSVIFSLCIIGGLAMLCFTKAFGIVFLGQPRHLFSHEFHESNFTKLFPTYAIAFLILAIGILPGLFVNAAAKPVLLFTHDSVAGSLPMAFADTLQTVSLAALGLIILSFIFLVIKKIVTDSKPVAIMPTWSCGYPSTSPSLQYTANSFVRSYRKLVHSLLIMNKSEGIIEGVFPNPVHSKTHPYDKIEALLIDIPIRHIRGFIGRFRFLQNGSVQFYVLYGVGFIFMIILLPLLADGIRFVIKLFEQI